MKDEDALFRDMCVWMDLIHLELTLVKYHRYAYVQCTHSAQSMHDHGQINRNNVNNINANKQMKSSNTLTYSSDDFIVCAAVAVKITNQFGII